MGKITIGVVGFGGMGSYHVEQLIAKEPQITVKGGYDVKAQRKAALEAAGYISYADYDALLADPEIEAVLIATPNDQHKKLAITALQQGKHVICEKPVTLNEADFLEILAVAEKMRRHFFVHQNRRWDPDFRIIEELYRSRMIGDLFQIESRVHGANGIPGDWRHVKEKGGGMVLDWGVHLLDQLLWLVDSPILRVQADLSFVLGDEVDDGFRTILYFKNGVQALVEVGTSNYIRLPRWYVKGCEGNAEILDWDLSGKVVRATGKKDDAPIPIQAGVGLTKTMAPPSETACMTVPLPQGAARPTSFYQNVYEVIRKGSEPLVKNEEVARVLRLMETIFAAHEQHAILAFEA